MYFNGEIVTEARLTILIVFYRGEKLGPCLGVENVSHLENRLFTLSNTSSPGIGLTFSERSSSSRCLATAVHFLSMAGSDMLRLSSKEFTRRARSSTGRERASSISFFVSGIIYPHIFKRFI